MPLKYLFIDNDEVKGLIEGLEEFKWPIRNRNGYNPIV